MINRRIAPPRHREHREEKAQAFFRLNLKNTFILFQNLLLGVLGGEKFLP